MTVTLKGEHIGDDVCVFLNKKRLMPERSQSVTNHPPDGFNWG